MSMQGFTKKYARTDAFQSTANWAGAVGYLVNYSGPSLVTITRDAECFRFICAFFGDM